MGAGHSTTAFVRLEQEQVYAGSEVRGRVYLNLTGEVSATAFRLEVRGKEATVVHYTRRHSSGSGKNRKTHTTHHYARASRELVRIDINLASWPSAKVGPGQFEFPFRFVLPPTLPTTMCCRRGGSHCSVQYTLRTHLVKPEWYKMDARSDRPLLVSMLPRPVAPRQVFTPPSTVPINLCCCIGRGTMSLGCAIDAACAARGEPLGVSIACKNDSNQPLDVATVTLHEVTHWRARGHSAVSRRVVARAAFDPSTISGAAALEAVPEHDSAAEKAAASDDALRAVYKQLVAASSRSSLHLSPDARDSYAGTLVRVTHTLTCVMKTPACVTDPEVSLPFLVQPRLPQISLPVTLGALIVETVPVPPEPVVCVGIPLPDGLPAEEEGAVIATWAAPPDGWSPVVAAEVSVAAEAVVVGGVAVDEADEDGRASQPESLPIATPVAVGTAVPSAPLDPYAALRDEMARSIDDLSIVHRALADAGLDGTLRGLSPQMYAALISNVACEFERPEVARLLGERLGGALTCAHVAAAVEHGGAFKAELVRLMAPMAADRGAAARLVTEKLSKWELIMCEDALGAWGAEVS